MIRIKALKATACFFVVAVMANCTRFSPKETGTLGVLLNPPAVFRWEQESKLEHGQIKDLEQSIVIEIILLRSYFEFANPVKPIEFRMRQSKLEWYEKDALFPYVDDLGTVHLVSYPSNPDFSFARAHEISHAIRYPLLEKDMRTNAALPPEIVFWEEGIADWASQQMKPRPSFPFWGEDPLALASAIWVGKNPNLNTLINFHKIESPCLIELYVLRTSLFIWLNEFENWTKERILSCGLERSDICLKEIEFSKFERKLESLNTPKSESLRLLRRFRDKSNYHLAPNCG